MSATGANVRCAYDACHGGPTKKTIVVREEQALAFHAIKPDGNLPYEAPVTDAPAPVLFPQPNNEFINVGIAFVTQRGQIEQEPDFFNGSVSFPRYRNRFYADGLQSKTVLDLPPPPQRIGVPTDCETADIVAGIARR